MRQKCTIKDIWGVIYPALIYTGITFLVEMIVIMSAIFMIRFNYYDSITAMGNDELMKIVNNLISEQLLFITGISAFATIPIFMMLMYFDKQKEKELGIYVKYTGHKPLTYLIIIPLAFTAMLFGNSFVSLIQPLFPATWLAKYEDTAQVLYGGSVFIQIVVTVIAAPIVEELLFRGLIFKRIRRVSNAVIAIILSALLFGVFHMNIVQGVYAFIIGAILAYVYEKYKTILAPIIFHMTANLCSVLVTMMSSSSDVPQETEIYYSVSTYIQLTVTTVVMGIFTFMLLYAINRSVKLTPKEKDEFIKEEK